MRDILEELSELPFIQLAVCSDAATHVEAEWAHGLDGVGDVLGAQTAGEEDGDGRRLDYATAHTPVVRAARAAEFLDGEALVAGVEQQRVHARRDAQSLVERLLAADVHDLHDRDAGQARAKQQTLTRGLISAHCFSSTTVAPAPPWFSGARSNRSTCGCVRSRSATARRSAPVPWPWMMRTWVWP